MDKNDIHTCVISFLANQLTEFAIFQCLMSQSKLILGRNIFGFSLAIFGKLRKFSENVQNHSYNLQQHFENFWKSSENGRKSLENRAPSSCRSTEHVTIEYCIANLLFLLYSSFFCPFVLYCYR